MPIADILLTIKPDLNQTQIQQFEDDFIKKSVESK